MSRQFLSCAPLELQQEWVFCNSPTDYCKQETSLSFGTIHLCFSFGHLCLLQTYVRSFFNSKYWLVAKVKLHPAYHPILNEVCTQTLLTHTSYVYQGAYLCERT